MSTISVDYDVLNQRGSPAWFSDTFANIPTAGFKGRMFISTDTFAFYRDTGTGWDLIGGPGIGTLTGSGVAGQVSFFNGTQVLAGNNNLFWDNVNSRLGINTTTPGQPLDIHSTGNTLVQLNNTTTANSNISFQNQNVAKWRVGNVYNAGANSFDILNATTNTTALSIDNTTNAISSEGTGSYGGVISLKQGALTSAGTGYTTLASKGVGQFIIYFGDTNLYAATILNNSLTASRSYTLPNATGTIALTSDLTSYVTLATAQTITGAKQFTSASKTEFTAGISISNTASGGAASGNTTIGANVNGLQVNFPTGGYNNLNFSSTTVGNTYTYPNATGTISLTSDLSSYLPLAGGTLTGNLTINPTNTGIIGLDVASNTTIIRSDNLEGFKRQLEIVMGSGTLVQLTAKGYLANYGTDMAFYTATTGGTNASPGIYITSTNNIGIGTGSPYSKLDVAGSISINGRPVIDNSSAELYIGGITGVSGRNTDIIAFYSANAERMRITSSGNLLIGTTTDNGNKLQVIGSNISTNGYFLGTTTATISALNTSVLLYSGAVSGIISLRDNTYGGSIAWLQDPNGGNITFANNLVNGTIIIFQAAGNTYIQKTTGSVPVNVQWVGLMQ